MSALLPNEDEALSFDSVVRPDDTHHRVIAEPHFIIKYGKGIHEMEGQVLLFLEHYFKDRPECSRIYAMYRLQQTNHICNVINDHQ
jgi:hypothetical protein